MTVDLKARLTLDTQPAEQASAELGKGIKSKIGAAVATVGAAMSGWKDKIKGLGPSIVVAAQAFRLAGDAAGALSSGVAGIANIFDTINARANTLARANFFGVTADQVELLRGKLGDVKSQLEATALASELVAGGFNKIQIGKFADGVNILSRLTGGTKQAAEDMLKAGELSEQALQALGRTRQEADAVVAQAAIAAGGRELTNLEKSRALLNAFGGDLEKLRGRLGGIGQMNPFRVLQKDIQSTWESVSVKLKPSLDDLVRIIQQNKDGLIKFFSGAAEAAVVLGGVVAKVFSKIADALGWYYGKIGAIAQAGVALVHSGQTAEAERIRKWQEEQLKLEMARQGVASVEKISSAAETAKKVGAVQLTESQKAARALAAQARLEAKQETLGRIAEARAMVRNFEMLAMEAAGAMGGPVSGALSAFKDSFEKFKVLGSAYGKTLTRLADTSEEELKRLRSAGKITESQLKAVQLFQTYLRAGELDLKEYLGTEKQVNFQLQAQGSLLAANNAIAAAQVEKLNQEKDVRAAITAITKTIGLLEGKDDVVSRRKLGVLKSTLGEYRAIQSQRSQILTLALRTAEIDKQLEKAKFSEDLLRQAKDLADATKSVRFELEAMSAKDDPVLAARLEAAQQVFRVETSIQGLQRTRLDNERTIAALTQKRDTAGQSAENQKLLDKQIDSLRLQNDQLVFQVKLQGKILDTSRAIFAINAAIATEKQRVERERALQDIEVQRLQLVQQLAGAQNKLRGEEAASLAAGQAKVALDRKIFDNQQRILEIEQRRRALAANPQATEALAKEAAFLAKQNSEIQRQIDLQTQLAERQRYLFTVSGALLNQLQSQAVDAAQKIGQAAASATMGLVSAFGTALSSLFEQLVQADKDLAKNFGKAVLSALGDMAIAFANTFAAVGVGRIALGDVAGGAGLIAASAALYIVAGTLKGLGAAIGAQSQPASPSASSPTQTTLPGQQVQREKEQRTTYVLISGFLGSEQEQYRKFQQFVRKNSRAVGG